MTKGVGERINSATRKKKFKHFIEIKCLGSILLLLNDFNKKVKLNWGNSHIGELEQSLEKKKKKTEEKRPKKQASPSSLKRQWTSTYWVQVRAVGRKNYFGKVDL